MACAAEQEGGSGGVGCKSFTSLHVKWREREKDANGGAGAGARAEVVQLLVCLISGVVPVFRGSDGIHHPSLFRLKRAPVRIGWEVRVRAALVSARTRVRTPLFCFRAVNELHGSPSSTPPPPHSTRVRTSTHACRTHSRLALFTHLPCDSLYPWAWQRGAPPPLPRPILPHRAPFMMVLFFQVIVAKKLSRSFGVMQH